MNKAVAKVEPQHDGGPTSAELAVLKEVISQGGTELNAAQVKITYLYAAKRGLDVISRQLIPTVMRGKLTFITTIDGFRVIAERSGDYAGQDPIKYGTKQPDGKGSLEWAEATVYRHSWKDRGLTVRAYWDEFCPDGGKDFMWKKMPHVMLGKVAEAQALRKAFPNDMSGMYSDDEMAQAGAPPVEAQSGAKALEVTDEDVRQADAAAEEVEVELADKQEADAPKATRIRRRKDEDDPQWAARLQSLEPAYRSESQQAWLTKLEEDAPWVFTASAEPVEGEVVEDGNLVAEAKQVFGAELPDADVDPERGGDPELPEPEPEPEPILSKAMELPTKQGDEGDLLEAQLPLIDVEVQTTPKGNDILVAWLKDGETRIEAVMAMALAQEYGAAKLGSGLMVDVKGTWTNVGNRLVVLASHIRAA